MYKLYPHQKTALDKIKNGSVLVGGTGSGKSLVGVSYFYQNIVGGLIDPLTKPDRNVSLYIITTPKKRDELDFQKLLARFGISPYPDSSINDITLVIDSWNNVYKYKKVHGSFFIFDEQRAIGSGVWARSFISIAKKNRWIMLSATPADKWVDLIPVFIAHGHYKNRTEFLRRHVVFAPYTKYPKIMRYDEVEHLKRLRNSIYVVMPHKKKTVAHVIDVEVDYDVDTVKKIVKTQWNPFTDKPIKNLPEHNHLIRRIINSDPSRAKAVLDIFRRCHKLIIFYNFNFELDILKEVLTPITTVSEYNGHKHQPLPDGNSWVYLVQYTSGYEAWECFTTNHMLFYSLNYSYRITKQSMGRIDRLTTTFSDLYYYRLMSTSIVDRSISKAFGEKKSFNEKGLRFE